LTSAACQPLVTVLTPVYNGEAYLGECMESVLGQTYQNWEYVVVNNRSTDRTRDIAADYAARDSRIRIVDNAEFVDVITNHNLAFAEIGPESAYCKLIQADDWMFPECIERLVKVAETSEAIGAVGSFCLANRSVECVGLEYPSERVNGRELARLTLLDKVYPFWSPSVLLIRSSVIRDANPFYREAGLHADVDAMYIMLRDLDFGFVHQVLTYVRHHASSMTAKDARHANTQRLSRIKLLVTHGGEFLDAETYRRRLEALLTAYYETLGSLYPVRCGKEFWDYQRSQMLELGMRFSYLRFWGSLLNDFVENPRRTIRRFVRSWRSSKDRITA